MVNDEGTDADEHVEHQRPLIPSRLSYRNGPVVCLLSAAVGPALGLVIFRAVAAQSHLVGVAKVVALCVALALAAPAAAPALRPRIVLTTERLLVRTLWTTHSFDWPDIASIVVIGHSVTVTSGAGTVWLPFNSLKQADQQGAPRLGGAVIAAWQQRRGEHWFAVPIDPWQPSRDLRDRAVLRNPVGQRVNAVGFVFILSLNLLSPNVPITESLVAILAIVLITSAFAALWHWRVALIVDADEVIVRRLLSARHIPRSIIVGADLVQPANHDRKSAWTLPMQARIRTVEGLEASPVPASGGGHVTNDPLFYRKLAWLDQELRSTTNRVQTSSGRSPWSE